MIPDTTADGEGGWADVQHTDPFFSLPTPNRADGEALAQCCMCGKTDLSTAEDGGPECELHDGRWVCSSECWGIAVGIIDRLIPRPAEPAQAAQDEGPQNRKLKTCKGCKHFVSGYWREPSGDGETYDSGTSADCTKAGRSISTYSGDEPAPPSWCPFLIAAAQEGRE